MSKNLYCPKCKVEFWGDPLKDKSTDMNDYKNDCSCSCGYIFTFKDFDKAMGASEDKEFIKDIKLIIKKNTRNMYSGAMFKIKDDLKDLFKNKYMID